MFGMASSLDSGDILRPLTESEFDDLLLLYKNNYEKTKMHYLSLYSQHTWNKKLDEMGEAGRDSKWTCFRKSFYTHRSGEFANGTYISLHWDLMLSVQFYTLESSLNELRECLVQTKLIDWKSGPLVTGVSSELYDFFNEIIKEVGAVVERPRECFCVALQQEEALRLPKERSPEGFSYRQLTPSDAEVVHNIWTNKKEGSLTSIKGLTLLNKTMGLVRDSDSRLVGWIFQNDFNGLGILQILPELQRKGYGIALTKELCKEIASEQSVDITTFYIKENYKSKNLFEKIGFKVLNDCWWIQLKRL